MVQQPEFSKQRRVMQTVARSEKAEVVLYRMVCLFLLRAATAYARSKVLTTSACGTWCTYAAHMYMRHSVSRGSILQGDGTLLHARYSVNAVRLHCCTSTTVFVA
jgi:hypothetical protein